VKRRQSFEITIFSKGRMHNVDQSWSRINQSWIKQTIQTKSV